MITLNRKIVMRWLAASAVAGALLLAAPPGLASAAPALPAPALPAPAAPAPPLPGPVLRDVWCSGPDQCIATGDNDTGNAISVAWNGQAWRYLKPPGLVGGPALACSSWTHCVAVGDSPAIASWNGTSWRTVPEPKRVTNLFGVSCPARRFCLAVGERGEIEPATGSVVWRGQSWQLVPVPWPAGTRDAGLSYVACGSQKDCVAYGFGATGAGRFRLALAWNGSKWRQVTLPVRTLQAIACPRPNLCIGIANGWSLRWNGHSWHGGTRLPGIAAPIGLSCPSASFCMLNTTSGTDTWNGTNWSPAKPARNGTSGLWCGGPADCMAVGGGSPQGNTSQWNGRTWRALRVNKIDLLTSVSCWPAGGCVALGSGNGPHPGAALAESLTGQTWQLAPGPGLTRLTGTSPISCPDSSMCMAISPTAAEELSGGHWRTTRLPALGDASLKAVSCASAASCLAVGGNVALAWNGTRWKATSTAVAAPPVTFTSVSCSGTICMAVGWHPETGCQQDCPPSELAELWNGSTWQLDYDHVLGVNLATHPGGRVACPTSDYCLAIVDNTSMYWTSADQSWHPVGGHLLAVPSGLSCGTPTSCLMVGTRLAWKQSFAELWNGSDWQLTSPVQAGGMQSVSCASPTACVAVGLSAYLQTMAQSWNGSSWSLMHTVNP